MLAAGLVVSGPAPEVWAAPAETQLVSANPVGNAGNDESFDPIFSPDGSMIAFTSRASNLGSTDTNSERDIYLRHLGTGITELVSVNAAGTAAGNGLSAIPVFSPDGSMIAFTSLASDLVPTDTNGSLDVYVRHLGTGTTELVSVNAAGTDAGNSASGFPVFSPDGSSIAFFSNASDLGPTDTNGAFDVYLRDLVGGTTELVSVNAAGTDAGDGGSSSPVFSPDGSKIAFQSDASDLGTNDTNLVDDIYVRDLVAATTELVSVNAAGTDAGNDRSFDAIFSPDGSRIAFQSDASNLGPTDTNLAEDIYVRDLDTGTTELVSVNAAGTDAGTALGTTPNSRDPVFSPDSSSIAFQSPASDLVPTDTNGTEDVFLRHLDTGTTELVSVNAAGTDASNGDSFGPVFSPDGRSIAFFTSASDLGPTDTNFHQDVYVRRLNTEITELVSVNATGTDAANNSSSMPVFSPDGSSVAFRSDASNFGPTDTNNTTDVYLHIFRTDFACGDIVVGTVVLTHNIGPCPGHGLLIGAPNTHIDLGGNRIIGSGVGTGVGVAKGVNARRSVVKNGTVTDFRHGVALKGGGRIEASDLIVARNTARGVRVNAARSVIKDVISQRNGTQGIFAKATNRSVVTDNFVRDNGRQGIQVRGDKAAIRGNVAYKNQSLGIFAPDKSGIKGKNFASDNNDGKRQCRPDRLC